MKKTDLGVVGIIYAICFGFLYMILQLPKSTQIYPLFITGIIFALTSLYLAKMIIGYKKVGIISDSGEFEDFFAKQFFTIVSFIVIYLIMLNFFGILYFNSTIYVSYFILPKGPLFARIHNSGYSLFDCLSSIHKVLGCKITRTNIILGVTYE